MKLDSSVVAAGQQCGVDVEGLVQKYSKTGQQSSSSQQQATSSSNKNTIHGMNRLDRFRICSECKGYGLVKEIYNHQIKEFFCEKCEGEGIVPKKE